MTYVLMQDEYVIGTGGPDVECARCGNIGPAHGDFHVSMIVEYPDRARPDEYLTEGDAIAWLATRPGRYLGYRPVPRSVLDVLTADIPTCEDCGESFEGTRAEAEAGGWVESVDDTMIVCPTCQEGPDWVKP